MTIGCQSVIRTEPKRLQNNFSGTFQWAEEERETEEKMKGYSVMTEQAVALTLKLEPVIIPLWITKNSYFKKSS